MRNRTLLTALCLAFSLGAMNGCILHTKDKPDRSRHHVKKKGKKKNQKCHPSQYWDGNKCRHKGKGKGARKHDN